MLYLRDRLTGLGGSGSRRMSEDIDRYPEFKRQFQARVANKDVVSVRDRLPKTIGPSCSWNASLIVCASEGKYQVWRFAA